ncbi:MAG: endonuclease domain-containing protein [Novosphingobium sp.]|uniref:endonuclease domain-containing protein n=1 Tax=Novosphingobium sp. TaxID=1874826 RepID=UPI003B991905
MKKNPPPLAIKRAREMRRNPTEAEKSMWRLLRMAFPRARFRRQVPIAHAIVDFASHSLRLVIEVDGGQHSPEADRWRDAQINNEGYRILRFWNNDVMENAEGVARIIAANMNAHSLPP